MREIERPERKEILSTKRPSGRPATDQQAISENEEGVTTNTAARLRREEKVLTTPQHRANARNIEICGPQKKSARQKRNSLGGTTRTSPTEAPRQKREKRKDRLSRRRSEQTEGRVQLEEQRITWKLANIGSMSKENTG